MDKKRELEQEIINLQSQLTSNASPIGDWKVSKCMEYQIMGMELPYDMNELHEKRQTIRDKINELQSKLLTMD